MTSLRSPENMPVAKDGKMKRAGQLNGAKLHRFSQRRSITLEDLKIKKRRFFELIDT